MEEFDEIKKAINSRNADAGAFLAQIVSILHFWDDLIDKDHKLSDRTINDMFELMLIFLPRNRFYMANFDMLNPILISAIQNWHLANTIERSEIRESYNISFIIRSSYVDIITMTAYLLGGQDFAQEIGMSIRLLAHKEGMTTYVSELSREAKARNGMEAQ